MTICHIKSLHISDIKTKYIILTHADERCSPLIKNDKVTVYRNNQDTKVQPQTNICNVVCLTLKHKTCEQLSYSTVFPCKPFKLQKCCLGYKNPWNHWYSDKICHVQLLNKYFCIKTPHRVIYGLIDWLIDTKRFLSVYFVTKISLTSTNG